MWELTQDRHAQSRPGTQNYFGRPGLDATLGAMGGEGTRGTWEAGRPRHRFFKLAFVSMSAAAQFCTWISG